MILTGITGARTDNVCDNNITSEAASRFRLISRTHRTVTVRYALLTVMLCVVRLLVTQIHHAQTDEWIDMKFCRHGCAGVICTPECTSKIFAYSQSNRNLVPR